jgi:hypothetical protein
MKLFHFVCKSRLFDTGQDIFYLKRNQNVNVTCAVIAVMINKCNLSFNASVVYLAHG